MSKCISMEGEYSDHEPNGEFVCGRCFAFDEDAAVRELTEGRARFADSEARRVELEAVIERVRGWAESAANYLDDQESQDIQAILSTAPSTVLGEHDQAVVERTIDAIDRDLQRKTVYAEPYADWKGDMTKKQRWYGKGYVSGLSQAFTEFRRITDAIRKGEHA